MTDAWSSLFAISVGVAHRSSILWAIEHSVRGAARHARVLPEAQIEGKNLSTFKAVGTVTRLFAGGGPSGAISIAVELKKRLPGWSRTAYAWRLP
jgi:hypothetical protein